MLWNSYLYAISPTFPSLPTLTHISPSMNSSPLQTSTGTFPHLPPTPHSLRWNSISFLDVSSLFHLSCLDPSCSSTGPLVCWFPFHILYAFLFRICSGSHLLRSIGSLFFFPFCLSPLVSLDSHSPQLLSLSWVTLFFLFYMVCALPLYSIHYKPLSPVSCFSASSMQSSLVSSLSRFTLRPLSSEAFPQLEQLSQDIATLHEILPRILYLMQTISGRRLLKDTPCASKIT